MKKVLLVLCFAVALLLAAVTTLQADKKKYKKMPAGTFTAKSKGGIDFVLTVPKSYDPSKGSPFLLCIHGDGQFRDMNDFKNVWSTMMTAGGSAGFVCCAAKSTGQNWAGGTNNLLGLIKELEEKYKFNIRQYVAVGHSSGASVAYQIALTDTKRFSAFGSMGGRLQINAEDVKKAGNLGAYMFHFAGDTTVDPSFSQKAAKALKDAGATVEHKEQPGGQHAIDYCVPAASKVMIPWFANWVKKKARLLTDPGNDTNLPWGSTLDFWNKLKEEKKAGLVYLYGPKDKDDKTAMWLRWEVFPDDGIKELAGECICMKVDYTNDNYKEAIKDLKVKSCALLVVDANKKVVKKITKPTKLDKLLKTLKKAKEKVEKSYK